MGYINLHHSDIFNLAKTLANQMRLESAGNKCYPIPRGGVPTAYLLKNFYALTLVDSPEEADFFLDDLIDSGRTLKYWAHAYPGKPFYALFDKREVKNSAWVVFPWEREKPEQDDSIVGTIKNRLESTGTPYSANDNISSCIDPEDFSDLEKEVSKRVASLLDSLLIDYANDHNTVGTPDRVSRMFLREVFKGRYTAPPRITDFPNAKNLDEMYMTGPITIRSACSHHLVPIIGRCWIGVIPGDRVIGLSKFNRIVDWLASRPQIQEELAVQVADFIEEAIQPKGLAVVIEATHMCMTWRGVKESQEAKMTTNVMRGVFREVPEARAEFMSLLSRS